MGAKMEPKSFQEASETKKAKIRKWHWHLDGRTIFRVGPIRKGDDWEPSWSKKRIRMEIKIEIDFEVDLGAKMVPPLLGPQSEPGRAVHRQRRVAHVLPAQVLQVQSSPVLKSSVLGPKSSNP